MRAASAPLVLYLKQTISVHNPMSSLSDAPDLVGFFSYSREDDEGSGGKLSKLRERIQEELRGQLGRDFRLWTAIDPASCGKTECCGKRKSSRPSLSRRFSY